MQCIVRICFNPSQSYKEHTMAVRTLSITSALRMSVETCTDKDLQTLASACNNLSRASSAFKHVKSGTDKRAYFASIAGVSRLAYDDAVLLVEASAKDSALRSTLKLIRASIVQRVRAASVVHDGALDAASVQRIDKIVSHMGTIVENSASIVRAVVVVDAPALASV
jgi:hypothetical protein